MWWTTNGPEARLAPSSAFSAGGYRFAGSFAIVSGSVYGCCAKRRPLASDATQRESDGPTWCYAPRTPRLASSSAPIEVGSLVPGRASPVEEVHLAVLRPPLVPAQDEEAVGRSALRKASLRLLPLIAIGYGIAYMDRINIGLAALQMNRDLHFSASVYGFGAGLFSIGYALCEIPSNLALYRFGARRWIARIMLTWGLLAMGMMFVQTPPQFYAVRFVLGMAEAGFFPGIMFYLLQWFPDNLRARAISRFYCASPLVAIANGLLAGPLMSLQGKLGLRGWQWLFLLEGFPAVLLSVVFLLRLPNTPDEARWLSSRERAWLKARLAADIRTGTHLEDTWASLRDKRIWLLGLLSFCVLTCIF